MKLEEWIYQYNLLMKKGDRLHTSSGDGQTHVQAEELMYYIIEHIESLYSCPSAPDWISAISNSVQ